MASTKPLAKPTSSKPPNTPTSALAQPLSAIHITTDQVQQLLDMLKQGQRTSNAGTEACTSEEKDDKSTPRIRASKPDIKKVYQIWNKSTYKFEIKESLEASSDEDDKYLEYIGVFRERFDTRQELEGTFVDIKSTAVRDILREVLKGAICVSLREDKPSIDPDVLFTYLPQLEEYHQKNAKSGHMTMLHLETLIKFLKTHYASKSEKLDALLKHKEITFELLTVFFRPNSIVYMVSGNSGKPRCLRFDCGQVKKSNDKTCFQLSCHHLTYDGICFGEAPATTEIQEFQGVMKITSLGVYPLEYHPEKEKVVEELSKRGQKFISLDGTHNRNYEGQAFYKKKEVKKFTVSGRVMIDAASFREKNPNYFFPSIAEKAIRG